MASATYNGSNAMLSKKRMNDVSSQLKWIADHNYDSYDSPTSQSNGRVAVYKADVSKLLDNVDWADKYNEVDTDGMQITLNNATNWVGNIPVTDPRHNSRNWHSTVEVINLYIISKIEAWAARSSHLAK